MKSGTRNVIIVAVTAAVLGGAVFALTRTGGSGSSSSDGASSAASIKLVSQSSQNVVSMKVTNRKGSYTLVPAGQSSLTSSAASSASVTYTVKELAGCPVDTDETSSVLQNGFSLTATKNLGTVSSLSDYGLSDPQASVEVLFKDGSTFRYKIGNATATDSSARYMCSGNSNTVYVVSVNAGLLESAPYFVKKQLVSLGGDASTQPSFTRIALSGSKYPQPVVLQAGSGGTLSIISPMAYDADGTNLSALQTCLSSLTADSAVALNPDAATLKKYGFASPTAVAEYTVNKKNYKITIGAQNGKSCYAMVDGVNVVYSVPADSVSAFAAQSLFGLRSKLAFTPQIETVKKISIVSGGKACTASVTRTEKTSSSTEDKKVYTYKVTGTSGKALDYDNGYKGAYEKLIGILLYADSSAKPSGTPAVTVNYSYFDKTGADTVEFYLADGHYTAVRNGKVLGLCTKNDVDTALQAFTSFAAK